MPPRAKRFGPRLGLAALLACAPKCVVCGLAYAGLFGLGGAELCGDSPATWPTWISAGVGALALAVFLWPNRRPRALSINP